MVPRQYVMKMSSGSSRPYEQAPSGSGTDVSDRTSKDNTDGSNNKRRRDTTSNALPAPMPFSPFSSSASSLKFRGTWAAMVMMLPVCFVCFEGVVVRVKIGRQLGSIGAANSPEGDKAACRVLELGMWTGGGVRGSLSSAVS